VLLWDDRRPWEELLITVAGADGCFAYVHGDRFDPDAFMRKHALRILRSLRVTIIHQESLRDVVSGQRWVSAHRTPRGYVLETHEYWKSLRQYIPERPFEWREDAEDAELNQMLLSASGRHKICYSPGQFPLSLASAGRHYPCSTMPDQLLQWLEPAIEDRMKPLQIIFVLKHDLCNSLAAQFRGNRCVPGVGQPLLVCVVPPAKCDRSIATDSPQQFWTAVVLQASAMMIERTYS